MNYLLKRKEYGYTDDEVTYNNEVYDEVDLYPINICVSFDTDRNKGLTNQDTDIVRKYALDFIFVLYSSPDTPTKGIFGFQAYEDCENFLDELGINAYSYFYLIDRDELNDVREHM